MVKKISAVFLISLLYSLYLNSQEFNVELTADKSTVGVNEDFIISLTVTSDNEDINIEDYPKLDQSISINNIGQSRSYNMMATNAGFQKSITLDLKYICKIGKEGNFNIGPFIIKVKNKSINSNTLSINVKAGANVSNNVSNQSNENNSDKDKNNFYILKTEQSKKEIFVNEFVDIEVNLYCFRGYSVRTRNLKKLNFPSNAWVENLINKNEILEKRVMINNELYIKNTIEKERIFISKPGEYVIEPFEIIFDSITSNDFFAIQEPIYLKTKPIYINVKPVEENQPKNYNGAIGNFKLSCALNPQKINPSEASTLMITLEGEGNFHSINDINFNIEKNIEIYSTKSNTSTVDNKNKIKTWEIILVPSKPGNYNIKIDDFCYFDITEKKYKTLNGNNLKLFVNGKAEDVKSKEKTKVNNNNGNDINQNDNLIKSGNIIDKEISYIKLNAGAKNYFNQIQILFRIQIIIYILFIVLILLFVLMKYFNYSLAKNNVSIIQKNSYKTFLNKISHLNKNISKIDANKGIDIISNAIETYFIQKFKIKSIEFTKKDIENKLKNYLNEEQINLFNDYIKNLNIIRFGGNVISINELNNLISDLKNLIKTIDETAV